MWRKSKNGGALYFALLFFFITLCAAKSIKFSIYKSSKNYYDEAGKMLRNTKSKPPTNESINLFKFMDAEYYGIIRIGSPAQPFKVIFDTTWADSWVPSTHCGVLDLACMLHARYDGSASSTYKEDGSEFKEGDTDASLRGFVSRDNFNLAHITVNNQSFIEMTYMPWRPWSLIKADGIVGLAFAGAKQINGPTFFTNMIQQNLIQKRLFAFYFNRDQTTERAGRLILGATARQYVNGSLTTIPVIEKKFWKVKMDRMSVDWKQVSHAFCATSCDVIFDTSSNTIIGPEEEIHRINILLGARAFVPAIFQNDRYLVNCREYAKLASIDLVFAGDTFTIHSKYYVQHLVYDGIEICLSPFVPAKQEFWQLGGAFLMEFYTEYYYDTGKIIIGKTKF